MKFLMLSLVAAASIVSVNANAKTILVTEKVCDRGESGMECQMVTYALRPASAPMVVKCVAQGDVSEVQCAPKAYGVPAWIVRLNNWFGAPTAAESKAAADREVDQYQKAGG
ncbi:hypothetical protein BH10BDE1_BH10BDE1_34850 [soil metagenome]